MTIILLLVGLGLVVLGADLLVKGASGIARRSGVSEFVIGLTIVGFGTSCPELVVSLAGAFQGNADVAVGNVTGSNLFNTLFILALTSLVSPLSMTRTNRRIDIPINVLLTLILLLFGMNRTLFRIGAEDSLERWEGILFLVVFAAYIVYSFRSSAPQKDTGESQEAKPLLLSIALALVGLIALVGGGEMFVRSATDLARQLGVSDKFIAVTVLACGTSLPELATSLVAALKGRDQLALGNILGSNVFNILFILGTSAVITPLSFASVSPVDASALLLSSLLLLLWSYTGRRQRIDRWEGALMLAAITAYYVYLFNKL